MRISPDVLCRKVGDGPERERLSLTIKQESGDILTRINLYRPEFSEGSPLVSTVTWSQLSSLEGHTRSVWEGENRWKDTGVPKGR